MIVPLPLQMEIFYSLTKGSECLYVHVKSSRPCKTRPSPKFVCIFREAHSPKCIVCSVTLYSPGYGADCWGALCFELYLNAPRAPSFSPLASCPAVRPGLSLSRTFASTLSLSLSLSAVADTLELRIAGFCAVPAL